MPKKKDDATLWECEEVALRYILEDGKLNLYVWDSYAYHLLLNVHMNRCLRLLVDYQEYLERVERRQTIISVSHSSVTAAETIMVMQRQPSGKELLDQFETGISLTLKNAWLHVEAMQVSHSTLLQLKNFEAKLPCPDDRYSIVSGMHVKDLRFCSILPFSA